MEQNKLFECLLLKIQEIEKQVSISDDVITKSAEEAEMKIEDHFAMCEKALAARKESMLRELSQKAAIQSKSFQDAKAKIKKAGDTCKQMAQTALLAFADNAALAESICMEALSFPTLLQFSTEIDVSFPENLLANIETHGKITGFDVSIVHAGAVSFDYPSRFSVANMVTTIAGSSKWGKHDGNGADATFNYPIGMCLNPLDDCLYVCDCNHDNIRKVSLEGEVSTYVYVPMPISIAIHLEEKAFFVTSSDRVDRISFDGKISLFARIKYKVLAPFRISTRGSITIDQQTGYIFICDSYNNTVQKVLSQGDISTFVENLVYSAQFNIKGICFDKHSNSLLMCDTEHNKILQMQLNGDVSTLCKVPQPQFIAITSNKTILVSSNLHRIYKVVNKGQSYEVSILAGSGKAESVDGNPSECSFYYPRGIVVHEPSHSCFVVDNGGHKIRKISFALSK